MVISSYMWGMSNSGFAELTLHSDCNATLCTDRSEK